MVEHPYWFEDLLHDHLGKFTLYVIKLSSNSMIRCLSYACGPADNLGIFGSSCHAKALIIPSVVDHVMHEVESISHTGVRLLDAVEVGLMTESQPATPALIYLDISTR